MRDGQITGAFGNIVSWNHVCSGCGGRSGRNWGVSVGVHARFVREAEGRIVGSIFLIVVGHVLHVRHGAPVTQLRSNHRQQVSVWIKTAMIVSRGGGKGMILDQFGK